MKYICLVYHERERLESLTEEELAGMMGECSEWVGELMRGGHHVLCAALQSTPTAATIRVRSGYLSVTDGPFAETKEFLGGFTILEARDLNEAIHLAAQCPASRIGSIEVRPLFEPHTALADPLDRRLAAAADHGAREVS